MSCLKPITVRNPKYVSFKKQCKDLYPLLPFDFYNKSLDSLYGTIHPKDEYITVPCGHCYECRKRKAREWRLRLLWEHRRHRNAIFVTLTVDDVHLADVEASPSKAIRRYLDLLRKYTNKGKYLKHWFITEHGDSKYNTGRLHFHGIIWDVSRDDVPFKELHKRWQNGFVWIGWCNARTCNYVVKYILKHKESVWNPKDVKQQIICSNGIGENYVEKHVYYHTCDDYRNAFICYSPDYRHRYPMPCYYKRKIFTDDDKLMMYYVLEPPDKWYLNGVEYTDLFKFTKARHFYFLRTKALGLSFEPSKRYESYIYSNTDFENGLNIRKVNSKQMYFFNFKIISNYA